MGGIVFNRIEGRSTGFWALLIGLGVVAAIGLWAAYVMDHYGHAITGMNRQVVWGIPHVFAFFLILASAGALNVASLSSVFDQSVYKPIARLSSFLAIVVMAGGLSILVLDLGRPDRLVLTFQYFNFTSIFSLNIFLYTGFWALCFLYLWAMFEDSKRWTRPVGIVAFAWRIILTTGTGSILGFIYAREMIHSALLAPIFIVLSLIVGVAIFILVTLATFRLSGRFLDDRLVIKMKDLLAWFVMAGLYLVVIDNLTRLYYPARQDVVEFLVRSGDPYAPVFWLGQILLGAAIPLFLFFHPKTGQSIRWIAIATGMVIVGAFAQLYVTVIGFQALPLELFPGMEVKSTFYDGRFATYTSTLYEWALGVGMTAMVGVLYLLGIKLFRMVPREVRMEKAL
ncbi:MAG: polysulfide reductase NrfD [Nitrospirae bacterium]|nr:polysulfide reductase NrfD [Nitrospirota bacterium]